MLRRPDRSRCLARTASSPRFRTLCCRVREAFSCFAKQHVRCLLVGSCRDIGRESKTLLAAVSQALFVHRMRFRVAEARTTLPLFLLAVLAGSGYAYAQPDYLAPIAAPAGSPCEDTAPDCNDICSAQSGSASACNLSTPIGIYLRCLLRFQATAAVHAVAISYRLCATGVTARPPVACVTHSR